MYGAAVAVGVCIFPLLFIRIFAPERFLAGNVLGCVRLSFFFPTDYPNLHTTDYFCSRSEHFAHRLMMNFLKEIQVGYSWIDGHAVQFASPGEWCLVCLRK